MRRFCLILSLLLWSGAAIAVGVDEQRLSNPAQEAAAREIMKELRCLVCQNQSIEDSDADLARDLRAVVRERIAAGDDEAGVKSYMVARYGDWILLKPPFNGRMALLWAAPVLLLGGALFIVFRRSRARGEAPSPLSADEAARLQTLLDDGDRGEGGE